ncbi:MAG TPA: helix-turn-helix domain-containing protein [Terrimesophilobacter sp.]|nr:helix-turn-helix domain-containing protein [Terrimesophilobacter sp.]
MEAARELFERKGYSATTVASIAAEAGVATATVYQAFGTKYAILARALDLAIVNGQNPVGLLDRPWVDRVRDTADPHDRLALVVNHTSEIAARTAALKRAMRDAAATDPEVGVLILEDHQRRLRTQRALVGLVLDATPLRPGLTRGDAVATFFGTVNSDCYLLMADSLGWDLDRWQRWLVQLLSHELFGTTAGPAP